MTGRAAISIVYKVTGYRQQQPSRRQGAVGSQTEITALKKHAHTLYPTNSHNLAAEVPAQVAIRFTLFNLHQS